MGENESNVPFLDSNASARKFRTHQRTSGANTVEEYTYVVAEPPLATYTISFASTVLSTTNSHPLQIMAGASLRVHLRRLVLYQSANAAANTPVVFELRRLTTAGTGGSGLVPAPMDTADAVAGDTAMVLPSSKGTEGVLVGGRHRGTILANASTANLQPILDLDWSRERTKGPIIAAGTSLGLALKNISTDASVQIEGYAEIVEATTA